MLVSVMKLVGSLFGGTEAAEPIRSLPIPEKNDSPVKVVVAQNYDELVRYNGQDTFIKFFNPACPHCKKLAPVFHELGMRLQHENVAIVKMDGVHNQVPREFQVRTYPRLYWLPKNKKSKPVAYTEGRRLEDMLRFVAKNASTELKGYDRKGRPKATDL